MPCPLALYADLKLSKSMLTFDVPEMHIEACVSHRISNKTQVAKLLTDYLWTPHSPETPFLLPARSRVSVRAAMTHEVFGFDWHQESLWLSHRPFLHSWLKSSGSRLCPSSGPLTFPPALLPGDPVTSQSRRPLACLTIISGILAHPCCAPAER